MAKKAKGPKGNRRGGTMCQFDGGCPNKADAGRVQCFPPIAGGLEYAPRLVCQAHKKEVDEARVNWI